MAGLRMICKLYGGLKFTDKAGNVIEYVWDYARDEARLKSDMDAEAISASERAKWKRYIEKIEKAKQGNLF